MLEVAITTNDFRPGGSIRETEKGYTVDTKITSEREYVASNAFGASTTVTATTFQTWGVIPKPGPLSGGATFSIKMPRSQAQQVKPNLGVLIAGTIERAQEPPVTSDSESNGAWLVEAKMDSPMELFDQQFLLRMEVADLWIFDRTTGGVLAKYSERPDHDKMQLSIFESKDDDGYAVVSLAGNKNLTLQRGFSKYGGCCQITVGGYYEIAGMKGRSVECRNQHGGPAGPKGSRGPVRRWECFV